MRWLDIEDIVIELEKKHPQVNLLTLRFTDLMKWILEIDGFNDQSINCNEKILEAIQASWIEEREQ